MSLIVDTILILLNIQQVLKATQDYKNFPFVLHIVLHNDVLMCKKCLMLLNVCEVY